MIEHGSGAGVPACRAAIDPMRTVSRRAFRRRIQWWIGVLGLVATSALWIIGAIRPFSVANDRLSVICDFDGGDMGILYSTNGRVDLPMSRGYTVSEYAREHQKGRVGRILPDSLFLVWGNLADLLGLQMRGTLVDMVVHAGRALYVGQIPTFWLQLPFILALAWLFFTRRPRRKPGHCQKCNYNLTGNTSGRCPECGEAVPAATASPGDLDRRQGEREALDAGS